VYEVADRPSDLPGSSRSWKPLPQNLDSPIRVVPGALNSRSGALQHPTDPPPWYRCLAEDSPRCHLYLGSSLALTPLQACKEKSKSRAQPEVRNAADLRPAYQPDAGDRKKPPDKNYRPPPFASVRSRGAAFQGGVRATSCGLAAPRAQRYPITQVGLWRRAFG
jgi:hypothetical protein